MLRVLPVVLLFLSPCLGLAADGPAAKPKPAVTAVKIWDQAPHNAFTDLVRFQDRWFCVFREGKSHVSPDGTLRIITSTDGVKWESAALITSKNSDLRDPKITVTPDGQLMLSGAEALHDRSQHTHQSLAWFSKDGRTWSERHSIGDPDFWLWRTTWYKGIAYSIGYGCGKDQSIRLYSSKDGKKFETLVERLFDVGYPNETSIVFDGDTAYCLLRRDGKPSSGLIGVSQAPYTKWEWKDLGVRIGGPHMIRLSNGKWVAAVRLYDTRQRTSLCWIDPHAGTLTEFLELPSGGDTSYAGLVESQDQLWVSYYSSHEGTTSVYLAKVPVEDPIRDIGSRRELFIDDYLIERLDRASLKLHEPVSGGVVIRNDKPWEGPANFGMSVIELDGRLLLYYRGMSLKDPTDEDGVACVAESRDDGATWTKPVLNRVVKPEWPNNNIIASDDGKHLFSFPCAPWVDTRPGVPQAERVKMIQSMPLSGERHTAMRDPGGPKRLVFWASEDGFTFRKLDPQPNMVSNLKNAFDGGNTMFWSEAEQQYVLYYRWYEGEWGRGYRSMARSTSRDWMTWTASVPMTYGDTPREQFYVNNTQPYFRAPHLYVAPAARFMEGRQVVTAAQAATLGVKNAGPYLYYKDCADGVLLTSRAGSTVYDRTFMETFIRPGLGAANWVTRTNYPLTGILPAGPERIQLFVARHYMQDTWHIERLLLRTDGFGSVNAPWSGGEMVTKPLIFKGQELEINYRTGAAGSVRVEIQDADGQPIPGYSLADCPEIIGDEIGRIVVWKQGTDISQLAGQPVRLRFVLRDADLFAIQFQSGK
jgi:hypothetical protein